MENEDKMEKMGMKKKLVKKTSGRAKKGTMPAGLAKYLAKKKGMPSKGMEEIAKKAKKSTHGSGSISGSEMKQGYRSLGVKLNYSEDVCDGK